MAIQSNISSNSQINQNVSKSTSTLSNVEIAAVQEAIEKAKDLFGSKQSGEANQSSNDVETLDMTAASSNTVLSSCTEEEYQQLLQLQLADYDTTIQEFETILQERQEELDKLEDLRVQLDMVEAEWTVSADQNNVDAQITNIIINDMTACPSERLEQLGMSQEDFANYTLEELKEIYQRKIPEIKALYDEAGTMYDDIIRQNTEFANYAEFKKAYDETKNDITTMKTAIKTLEKKRQEAPYNLLPLLQDYQEFQTDDIKLDHILDECLIPYTTGYYISYTKYCDLYGPVSELAFLEAIKEHYPTYQVIGIENQDKLENILNVSDEDENLAKIYDYLYQTEGKEKAHQYLEDIEDYTNNLLGKQQAEAFLATLKDKDGTVSDEVLLNHFKTAGKGLMDGVESFGEGLAAIINSSDVYSANEYEALYIAQGLQEMGQGLSFNYQISQGIGNMLPSIALGTLWPPLGSISLGLSSGGNSYHNALVEGYDVKTAVIYGIAAGSSDALLERLCGSIPGIAKADDSTSLLVKMLKEGGQEYAQEVLTSGIYSATILGKEVDLTDLTSQSIQSFIAGAITAGILNTPGKILHVIVNGKQIAIDSTDIQTMIEQIDEGIDPIESFNTIIQSNNEIRFNENNGYQLNASDITDQSIYHYLKSEQVQNIISDINQQGFMSLETGQYLQNLLADQNYDIYIKTINSQDLTSINQSGIYCNGNVTSGFGNAPITVADINLENTITKVDNMIDLVRTIKNANGLSQGLNPIDGTLIIKIPKGASIDQFVYYNQDAQVYCIDPSYIEGFLQVDQNKSVSDIKLRKDSLEQVTTLSEENDSNVNIDTSPSEIDVLQILKTADLDLTDPAQFILSKIPTIMAEHTDDATLNNELSQLAEKLEIMPFDDIATQELASFIPYLTETDKNIVNVLDLGLQLQYQNYDMSDPPQILISKLVNYIESNMNDETFVANMNQLKATIEKGNIDDISLSDLYPFFSYLSSEDLKEVLAVELESMFSSISRASTDTAVKFSDSKQYVISKLQDIFNNSEMDATLAQKFLKFQETIMQTRKDQLGLPHGTDIVSNIPEDLVYEFIDYLSPEDQAVVNSLITDPSNFNNLYTKEEQGLVAYYTKTLGPLICAYLRNTTTIFNKSSIDGTDVGKIMDQFYKVLVESIYADGSLSRFVNIDEYVKAMDQIIEKSPALKEDTTVYRSCDSLFLDGNKITNFEIGTQFNDAAFVSTSVEPTRISNKSQYVLQIEIPAGTKAAYLESMSGVARYSQQELLLGRNHTFEIIDLPQYVNGKTLLKVRLVSQSSFADSLNLNQITDQSLDNTYYNSLNQPSMPSQVELTDVVSTLRNSGLLARYEAEVRYLKSKGYYQFNYPEHNIDHVERVLLYSMYMGEKLQLNDWQLDVLIEAAKFHDVGREFSNTNHSEFSAKEVINALSDKYSQEELALIAAAIEYHEVPDNDQALQSIAEKYDVQSQDYSSLKKIATILKDADAIDRVRFPGNLNVDYLRTTEAKTLVKSAYQLQELRANIGLNNNIQQNQYDSATLQIINQLKSLGVADYMIYFYLENRNNSMPIVSRVKQYLDYVLEGGR